MYHRGTGELLKWSGRFCSEVAKGLGCPASSRLKLLEVLKNFNRKKNDDYTHLYMVDSQFISESTSGYTDGPALHYVFAMSGESYANDDFDIPYDMLSIPYGITGETILELFYLKF